MDTRDTTIRLSNETKTRLEHRKRGEESFEAVINRLIDESADRDLLAGFGAGADSDRPAVAREIYERSRRESRERIGRIAAQDTDRRGEGNRDEHDDSETPQ